MQKGSARFLEFQTDWVIDRVKANDREIARLQRESLRLLRQLDVSGEWDGGEVRDVNHYVARQLQISWIDAKRRVDAAHAIEELPLTSAALESGELSLDKTVQLTRFATPEKEEELVEWAKTVSLRTVRENADAAQRHDVEDAKNNDRFRNFGWRKIENGTAFSFFGAMPAEQGAVFITAIDRIADSIKTLPEEDLDVLPEEAADNRPQRRADALVLLASQRLTDDFDADRATVIVQAPLEALVADVGFAELDDGARLHPEIARRLTCDSRIQTVIVDGKREPIGIGRVSQTVPPWLKRLVKQRDRCCTFPGCEDMRYNQAHHVWHWALGGPTDLDNLILVCGFHHKLVHEHGWGVNRRPDGTIEWFTPGGRLHGARLPRPDIPVLVEQPELVNV